MAIETALNSARKILMECWPITSFIATNPLWGMRSQKFFDVISSPCLDALMSTQFYYEQYQQGHITVQNLQKAIAISEKKQLTEQAIYTWINQSIASKESTQSSKLLLSKQVGEYQFNNATNWIKEKIYIIFQDYFSLEHYKKTDLLTFWRQQEMISDVNLEDLSKHSIEQAIEYLRTEIQIPSEILAEYFQHIYIEVYGWASFMNWRNNHADNPWYPGSEPCEVILLIWLVYEATISIKQKVIFDQSFVVEINSYYQENMKNRYIWQIAFELNYADELESSINYDYISKQKITDAQFIFCIDTRSEGLRRHIESQGNFETFGFAGFFGIPFKLNESNNISYQAPALVDPSDTIELKKNLYWTENIFNKAKEVIAYTKRQLISPFGLFEICGFWYLFYMLFKNFQSLFIIKRQKNIMNIHDNLSESAKVDAAYNLLTSIGLIQNFSNYVIITAHQSDNINNPFKSSLDCGACGGNSGIPNAIVMCKILNDKKVRAQLVKKNISIPESTVFIPACHHTVYDRLEILEGELPSEVNSAIFVATENLRIEKRKKLPGSNELLKREKTWSELIPELALINNSSIIIGPRELTVGKDLACKSFLHSYSPELDPDAKILSGLLSAPAIVAHWINCQYFFSTVNPELFGAGNKAIHNVLPGLGVIEGNLSDLKIGLPQQSIFFQSKPLHQPRRLLVVVYANKDTLDKAIENAKEFKQLLDNNWIYLKHIEAKI